MKPPRPGQASGYQTGREGSPSHRSASLASHIQYWPFLSQLGPVALVGLALDTAILAVVFRRELKPGPLDRAPGREPRVIHRGLLVKSLLVTAAVVTAFLIGIEPALVAAGAAAALLVTRRVKPEKVYRQIDWDLLVLFIGLFVVVAGVERVGLARWLFATLEPIGPHTVAGLSVVSVIVSNVISNVPAVMLMSRLVPELPDPTTAWLTLAMASTLAGNLLLHSSIANLIVLQGARRLQAEITFWQYIRVGLPVTILTVLFGIWWLS